MDSPEDKCICALCRESQLEPITQTDTAVEVQTTETDASEVTMGQTDTAEMTIQTDASDVTIGQTDVSVGTGGQTETLEVVMTAQADTKADVELPMELGRFEIWLVLRLITGEESPVLSSI